MTDPIRVGGLGLGLYIGRQIASAHGGTLTVESAPDQGATFILDLPLERRARPGYFVPGQRPKLRLRRFDPALLAGALLQRQ